MNTLRFVDTVAATKVFFVPKRQHAVAYHRKKFIFPFFNFYLFCFWNIQGITLPVPPNLEPLEEKMPAKSLQNPLTIDFLKVNI